MNNNETNKILNEILKWQKLQGSEILKKKIKEEGLFDDEKNILVYYHSDGEKSIREILKITGFGHATIQALWKKWIAAGIAEPAEKYKGRCKRIFELHEIGLVLPKSKKGKN